MPSVYSAKHLTLDCRIQMFVIMSNLPHEAKAVL